ncbi:hypothetical protein C8J57DRAFT_117468 [Mycena rebaudengoi]|nr:hypothetical protein C8J57DRAFT_117468 [Mycena rebaudengoi]
MRTLFDPIPELLGLYTASSLEMDYYGPKWPYIHSSLGMIIRRLSVEARDGSHYDKIWRFVLDSPSPMIRLRTAEISLRLLGYRTAELKPMIERYGVSYGWVISYIRAPRHDTHWYFASRWCRCLIQAPPVTELLDTFRQMVEDTFWIRAHEFDRRGLLVWLNVRVGAHIIPSSLNVD